MIPRSMESVLRAQADHYPVVTLTGPRQSGKTTLARAAFPRLGYVNLEDPDLRDYARNDPREFLRQHETGLVIDEAQRAPDLFSHIQVLVDQDDRPGRFILTGSHNFLLMKSIRQSLAGRAAILHLLPLSLAEVLGRPPFPLDRLGLDLPAPNPKGDPDLLTTLFQGGYPRLHDKGIPAQDWLANYFRTYVERDVQEILDVGDRETFGRFMGLCAGRTGQLLNLTSLAGDCGITHPTAKRWLSVLETSFLVKLLRPHHRNFNKRLIKSPKLYFLDTGLLCYLLRIRTPEELRRHPARGAVFESFVLAELTKNFLNRGLDPDLYFWRDSSGNEIDFLIELGQELLPIEAKSGTTPASDFLDGLNRWNKLAGRVEKPSALFYGGLESSRRLSALVYSWASL